MELINLKRISIMAGCEIAIVELLLDFCLFEFVGRIFSVLDQLPYPSDLGIRVWVKILYMHIQLLSKSSICCSMPNFLEFVHL